VDDGVADAGGLAAEDLVALEYAEGEGVDDAVAVVAVVEGDLATHGGDADRVAVAGDAGDDAIDEPRRLRMRGRAEAQAVQRGDGPRAHGEHVAEDAADAGRRALVGLDVRRVVVA